MSAFPYIWQAGDTPELVAAKRNIPLRSVRAAFHGIDPMAIEPGHALRLPPGPSCPTARFHIVKEGDSIATIARARGVSVFAVMDLNPYVNPEDLMIGEILCIPR